MLLLFIQQPKPISPTDGIVKKFMNKRFTYLPDTILCVMMQWHISFSYSPLSVLLLVQAKLGSAL